MQLDTAQIVVGLIVLLFGREAGARALRWAREAWTGRAASEKQRVRDLVAARRCAEADRDHQAKWRRIQQEYSSELIAVMLREGVPRDRIPPFPSEPER